jgi:hypothetical protein
LISPEKRYLENTCEITSNWPAAPLEAVKPTLLPWMDVIVKLPSAAGDSNTSSPPLPVRKSAKLTIMTPRAGSSHNRREHPARHNQRHNSQSHM